MTKKIKIIIGVLVSGMATGLFMFAFGLNGPIYRTEVVNLPVNLQSPSKRKVQFTVDRSEEYMIEIHLKSVFPEQKMDKILGDYVEGGGGEINVSWEVTMENLLIAQGSNTKFGYSPIWSRGHSGLAIGTISAQKGKEYTLSVITNNVSSDWNRADPYIEVGLHPNKLESYLVLQIFGILVASVFGVGLVIVALLHLVSKRRAASNKALQPTQRPRG